MQRSEACPDPSKRLRFGRKTYFKTKNCLFSSLRRLKCPELVGSRKRVLAAGRHPALNAESLRHVWARAGRGMGKIRWGE